LQREGEAAVRRSRGEADDHVLLVLLVLGIVHRNDLERWLRTR
jgi:hypothetical protein